MNCEKAEDYLSAYLDGMLDPSLRQDLTAHLEQCERCQQAIADYRWFDGMLAALPRVSPAEELHSRIFDSPEFTEIMRRRRDQRSRGAAPPWTRVALQSAAVLALLVGSALLIKQGFLHSAGTPSTHDPLTIAGPDTSGIPLSAGARAVYLHDGRLWSAPVSGHGLSQPLTPANITVAGWSVAPNRQMVAYIDTRTGAIHVIRSDGQNDTRIATIANPVPSAAFWNTAAGQAVASGLAWTPDGAQIAFVAPGAGNGTILRLVNRDGTNNRAVAGDGSSVVSHPVWSGDSLRLAYVETAAAGERVAYYDTVGKTVTTIAPHADANVPSARVETLAWLPSASNPGLTWSASNGHSVTGLFSYLLLRGQPQRLTPADTSYAAADYTTRRPDGAWVVATAGNNPGLYTLSPETAGVRPSSAQLNGSVSALAWSPTGSTVAYVAGGNASIWEPGSPAVAIASDASGEFAWSPDGHYLALFVRDSVIAVRVSGGTPAVLMRLVHVSGPVDLSWSTDSSGLAVASNSGLYLATLDGKTRVTDHASLAGTATHWTEAG